MPVAVMPPCASAARHRSGRPTARWRPLTELVWQAAQGESPLTRIRWTGTVWGWAMSASGVRLGGLFPSVSVGHRAAACWPGEPQ